MTTIEPVPTVDERRSVRSAADRLGAILPKIVLAPSFAITLVFVYGFILWTVSLSFMRSRILPVYDLIGFDAYYRLWSQPHWYMAIKNLGIFGSLYTGFFLDNGLFLPILQVQPIRSPGVPRPIFPLPTEI